MPNKGFTLIELMVVITIITILATIGLISYQTVLKSGRDAKRQSDLRSIQSALEQYHNDQGYYPFAITFGGSLVRPSTGAAYINQIPQDPKGNPDYAYQALGTGCDSGAPRNCTNYCLFAKLENSSPGLPSGCINNLYNFAVTPP